MIKSKLTLLRLLVEKQITMIRYYYSFSLILAVCMLFLSSCVHHPDVPSASEEEHSLPALFPDYCDVTVPYNIAPLNFMLADSIYTECVARITAHDGRQHTYGNGLKVQIPEAEWHEMLNSSKSQSIKVEVWGLKDNVWHSFSSFQIKVSEQPIDEYLSYRLIEPSYLVYGSMEIAQRDMTSFSETQVFNNTITSEEHVGQCINCHSYQNYKTDNMLFHVRNSNGGTVIVNDGKVIKVDLKRDYTISSGVYPAWHPVGKLIAFSTNKTAQVFNTKHHDKVEVCDAASDLILYDIVEDSVSVICNDPDLLEVYPTWSPDGKYLYYCKSVPLPEDLRDKDIRYTFQYIKYNLYRRAFDLSTHLFGDEELVYDAAALNKSVSLPRISPDGHYLLCAEGKYGCFHIWHHDADIICLPLDEDSSSSIDITNLNSEGFAESYPSWSSNGSWIMCASRRDDGNYSHVYISYFHDGKVEKAFLLPQEDPELNIYRLKSYNRPEFMVEPVTISVNEFSKVFSK